MSFIRRFGHLMYRLIGFTSNEYNGVRYWYRDNSTMKITSTTTTLNNMRANSINDDDRIEVTNPTVEQTELPLLFFHGITPGLNMYLYF